MFLSTTLCEHVWTMWLRLAFHRRNEKWKCTSNPTSAIARATFCPQLLDIPWHSLTLFSLVHLVQIELKPRRHDCPHRHFYRLRKGRCLRKQWMGARKAHHARVTIQSGEDESEVCEPQTANKFLRDWAFLWISFPIFFSSYPNHSCGSKLPHCCTKQNVLVHTTCAIRFDCKQLSPILGRQSVWLQVIHVCHDLKQTAETTFERKCRHSMLQYVTVYYSMLHYVTPRLYCFFSFAFVSGSNGGHINQSFHSRPAAGMGRHTSQTSIRVSAFMSFP